MAAYREYTHKTRDGLSLYYRAYGPEESTRTPVLCLSGLTRNGRDFHELALHLGRTRTVMCLDYRGCGRSDRDLDYMNYQVDTDAGGCGGPAGRDRRAGSDLHGHLARRADDDEPRANTA